MKVIPLGSLALVVALTACGNSSGGASAGDDQPGIDAGDDQPGIDAGDDQPGIGDGGGLPDGAVPPVDVTDSLECFYDTDAACAAPVIDAAYLTTNCQGTTGVFVVGHGFRSPNKFNQNNGWLASGPGTTSPKLGSSWNVLTPTFMCITTSADAAYWSGFDLAVVNHDGKMSNTVTVANLLGSRPPLVSTGSAEPFDPDACLDAGMTQQQALARFPTGSSTTTIANVTIYSRTRACNTATGCTAWNTRTSLLADQAVGFSLSNSGQTVNFTLAGQSCGALNVSNYTTSYNTCSLSGQTGSFRAHAANACTAITRTTRSTVQSNGNYTQTDDAALLRY